MAPAQRTPQHGIGCGPESLTVAKKNTSENEAPAAPKRATTRRASKPAAMIATADDNAVPVEAAGADNGNSAQRPTPDEIAQAAYQRYLSRGGADGRDFDDWIEAERELTSRHSQ
jgi:hypothetical protein